MFTKHSDSFQLNVIDSLHTIIFYYLGITFSITHDICYTGFSGRNSFVYFRHLHKIFSVHVPITHINCLGIDLPIARTFVTKKCLRIICEIISGLIVLQLGAKSNQPFPE